MIYTVGFFLPLGWDIDIVIDDWGKELRAWTTD